MYQANIYIETHLLAAVIHHPRWFFETKIASMYLFPCPPKQQYNTKLTALVNFYDIVHDFNLSHWRSFKCLRNVQSFSLLRYT